MLYAPSAEANDRGSPPVFMGLPWGADAGQLAARVKGLEPERCDPQDEAVYRSMNWACEGFVHRRHQMGAAILEAHFRMSENFFRLTGIIMIGVVPGTRTSAHQHASLVSVCTGLQKNLELSFGRSHISSADQPVGHTWLMAYYEAPELRTRASIECVDAPNEDQANITVTIEPLDFDRRERL